MAQFTGIEACIAEIRAAIDDLEQKAIAETKRATRIIQAELFANTPVWSGETVRNYRWAVGAAPARGTLEAIGSGEPGPTNHLPMGEEPRRAANEDAALADMESTLAALTKLSNVFGTNTAAATKWNMVDSGVAPAPGKARNPGGVELPAIQAAKAKLGATWK